MDTLMFFTHKVNQDLINDRQTIDEISQSTDLLFIKSFNREDFNCEQGYYEYTLVINEINMLSKSPFLRSIIK